MWRLRIERDSILVGTARHCLSRSHLTPLRGSQFPGLGWEWVGVDTMRECTLWVTNPVLDGAHCLDLKVGLKASVFQGRQILLSAHPNHLIHRSSPLFSLALIRLKVCHCMLIYLRKSFTQSVPGDALILSVLSQLSSAV